MVCAASSGVPEINSPRKSLPKSSMDTVITAEVIRAITAAERMPFLIRLNSPPPRFWPTKEVTA